MDERKFYVYLIRRPNGVPCYVGKGKGIRWLKHAWRSTNPHLAHIYAQAGGKLPREKVKENLTESEAFALEKELIAAIGREIHGGPLVNMSDGGEGNSGFKMSEETIRRIAAVHVGNKYNLGLKRSDETRALQRSLKLGKRLSKEHRANIGSANSNKGPRPSEWCAAISAGKVGKLATPERRAALKAANRSRDPKVRANIRMGMERSRWERSAIFVSPFSQWGDGASAGLI